MSDQMTQMQLEEALTAAHDMLAPDPLVVRLNKVFSWQQSASRWPYYLSRAEPGRAYTKQELIQNVFTDDQSHHKAPDRGWLQALYSIKVDRKYADVVIDGIGLFELEPEEGDRYHITDDGLALAHSYSADRNSANWKRVFAGILARNDVRLRCMLLHLSRWDHLLVFRGAPSPDAFFPAGKEAVLRDADRCEHPLFGYTKGGTPAYTFTPLLQRDPLAALGPFIAQHIERLGVRVPQRVRLEGGREAVNKVNHEPSGNDLRGYMKQALSLFRDIGVLVYVPHRQGWTLDRERCATLFEPELVNDLFGGAPERRFLDALREAYRKYSDQGGLVHIATIRDAVCDELDIAPGDRIDYFNKQVAYYMRPDVAQISIGSTFHAQAMPQDCLFGDLSQEYVEFRFIS
jgi:hypothetical protein